MDYSIICDRYVDEIVMYSHNLLVLCYFFSELKMCLDQGFGKRNGKRNEKN